MFELSSPYVLIRGALTSDDLCFLKSSCKDILARTGTPCYALIDRLETRTFGKIHDAIAAHIAAPLHYLNDFYLFTDRTSRANWHIDTELFTFASAVNAWILLSPEAVTDPLGFVDGMNDSPDNYYHSVKIVGDEATFCDMCTGRREVRSLRDVESAKVHTPRIELGDILIINPRRFHKTNVDEPKHCHAIKFVFEGDGGFLAAERRRASTYGQVPAFLWPEVATFNALVKGASGWDGVLSGLRRSLDTEEGQKRLSSGFFPENFPLYQQMVGRL